MQDFPFDSPTLERLAAAWMPPHALTYLVEVVPDDDLPFGHVLEQQHRFMFRDRNEEWCLSPIDRFLVAPAGSTVWVASEGKNLLIGLDLKGVASDWTGAGAIDVQDDSLIERGWFRLHLSQVDRLVADRLRTRPWTAVAPKDNRSPTGEPGLNVRPDPVANFLADEELGALRAWPIVRSDFLGERPAPRWQQEFIHLPLKLLQGARRTELGDGRDAPPLFWFRLEWTADPADAVSAAKTLAGKLRLNVVPCCAWVFDEVDRGAVRWVAPGEIAISRFQPDRFDGLKSQGVRLLLAEDPTGLVYHDCRDLLRYDQPRFEQYQDDEALARFRFIPAAGGSPPEDGSLRLKLCYFPLGAIARRTNELVPSETSKVREARLLEPASMVAERFVADGWEAFARNYTSGFRCVTYHDVRQFVMRYDFFGLARYVSEPDIEFQHCVGRVRSKDALVPYTRVKIAVRPAARLTPLDVATAKRLLEWELERIGPAHAHFDVEIRLA